MCHEALGALGVVMAFIMVALGVGSPGGPTVVSAGPHNPFRGTAPELIATPGDVSKPIPSKVCESPVAGSAEVSWVKPESAPGDVAIVGAASIRAVVAICTWDSPLAATKAGTISRSFEAAATEACAGVEPSAANTVPPHQSHTVSAPLTTPEQDAQCFHWNVRRAMSVGD